MPEDRIRAAAALLDPGDDGGPAGDEPDPLVDDAAGETADADTMFASHYTLAAFPPEDRRFQLGGG